MKHILFSVTAFALMFMSSCSTGDKHLDFTGEWSVDFDRTLEESKKSPKYTPDAAKQLPEMIKRMMGVMKIRITPTEMIHFRGTKETKVPYTVVSSAKNETILSSNLEGQELTITLKMIDGKYMNFRSSSTDDLTYYIWTRE